MTPARVRVPARLLGAGAGLALAAGLPTVAFAHGLTPLYQSPLPLAVYLAGAAATVALSFLFVLARDMRAAPAADTRVVVVPGALRLALPCLGVRAARLTHLLHLGRLSDRRHAMIHLGFRVTVGGDPQFIEIH